MVRRQYGYWPGNIPQRPSRCGLEIVGIDVEGVDGVGISIKDDYQGFTATVGPKERQAQVACPAWNGSAPMKLSRWTEAT
jgi:hypothetical protein